MGNLGHIVTISEHFICYAAKHPCSAANTFTPNWPVRQMSIADLASSALLGSVIDYSKTKFCTKNTPVVERNFRSLYLNKAAATSAQPLQQSLYTSNKPTSDPWYPTQIPGHKWSETYSPYFKATMTRVAMKKRCPANVVSETVAWSHFSCYPACIQLLNNIILEGDALVFLFAVVLVLASSMLKSVNHLMSLYCLLLSISIHTCICIMTCIKLCFSDIALPRNSSPSLWAKIATMLWPLM